MATSAHTSTPSNTTPSGKTHDYTLNLTWTGNTGAGTASYAGYERSHDLAAEGVPTLPASADAHFRGDRSRWNPELLLLASAAECHMLFVLSLATRAGVTIVDYRDDPVGTMAVEPTGGGRFTGIELRPRIVVAADSDPAKVEDLHHKAHELCFIANSLSCPITVAGSVDVA